MSQQKTLYYTALISLGALLTLFISALIFYKERTLFADAAFVLFNILTYKKLYIQELRLGSAVTQVVPFLGQLVGVPIKWLLLLYSASFSFFYLLVASILTFAHRQYSLAILATLYYLLFVTDAYYWTNNEVHQGVSWLFLALGTTLYLLHKDANRIVLYIAFTLLFFIAIFTHFLVMISLVYLWVYLLLDKEPVIKNKADRIGLSIVLIAIVATKFTLSLYQPYDGSLLHGVTHFSLLDVGLSFQTPVVLMFAKRCLHIYWTAIPITIAGLWALSVAKQRKQLIWTITSIIGYTIVMGLTYGGYDADVALFHIESEWMSIAIVCGAPFVFVYLPRLDGLRGSIFLIILFCIRFSFIEASSTEFTWRVNFIEHAQQYMRSQNVTKMAINIDDETRERLKLDWALGDESILCSALYGDKTNLAITLFQPSDTAKVEKLNKPATIAVAFNYLPPAELNKHYFNIDTTTTYTTLSSAVLWK